MVEFLRKLLQFARPYRTRMVLGICFGALYALSNALLVLVVRVATDLVFSSGQDSLATQIAKLPQFLREPLQHLVPQNLSPTTRTGVALAICAIPLAMLVRGVCLYLSGYLMDWAAVRAVADIRSKLFARLQYSSMSFFHLARSGELISRIMNDILLLHYTFATSFSVMIRSPITIVALLAVLLVQQPRLTLISLLVFPVCLVPIVVYGRKTRKSTLAAQGHLAELTDLMQESFTSIRIVKAYNLEDTVIERFRETTRRFVSQNMRIVRAQAASGPVIELLASVGVALVLLYVTFSGHATVTAGDFLSFITSIFLLYQPVKEISRLHNQLEQARAASQRVFELLEMKNSILEPERPVPLRAARAPIHFDDVHFSYGDKLVLQAIKLTGQPGQMVALVGASGSGKTTLTNLLLRFYDPQRGAVRIGDVDIRNVSTRDLRNQIAVVTQETILFNETVRNNIALGRPGASNGEIEAAARHAFAHEFIMAKESGYDTIVGEKGVILSGGQRQRLAIARAILKNAPILVLDEAMSALDTESERMVQAALEELMIGRTTICIAHRLSTVQKADLIVVLDQGRIVETGRHAELIKQGGIYQKLYELQFQA